MASVEEFIDKRDGRTYKITVIGDAVWLAENLDFKVKHSFPYENLEEYRKKYGLLYTYEAALEAIPSGWRLPKKEDWDYLFDCIGGKENTSLLSGNTFTSFHLSFGGCKEVLSGFENRDSKAYFWLASEFGNMADAVAFSKNLNYPLEILSLKQSAFSVRLVLDA